MAVLNVELINDLDELKEEADKLEEEAERIKKTIKEEEQNLKEKLKYLEKIKEKINSIQEEKKEENEPLTWQQIEKINIDDLLKVDNIFSYSKYWMFREVDKFKIIKISNNFITAKKLKQVKIEHLGGSGGYDNFKCILRDRRDDEPLHHQEKPFLRISKNKLDSSYFFKDGLRYELNKEFNYTEDNGR
jgi:DNA gyrase/topoisomerase IV subunit A